MAETFKVGDKVRCAIPECECDMEVETVLEVGVQMASVRTESGWASADQVKRVGTDETFKVGDEVVVPVGLGYEMDGKAGTIVGISGRYAKIRFFLDSRVRGGYELEHLAPFRADAFRVGDKVRNRFSPDLIGEVVGVPHQVEVQYADDPHTYVYYPSNLEKVTPPTETFSEEVSVRLADWSSKEDGPGIAKKIPVANRRFLSQTTSWDPYGDWDNLPDE